MKRKFRLDPVPLKNNSTTEKTKLLLLALLVLALPLAVMGQGSTYTGTYTKSAPVKWSGISNQTISGLEISNPSGDCISLTNCSNITIKNCKLTKSLGKGVYLYNCKNVTITNCTMDSVSTGVYAGLGGGIKVMYNDVKNVIGPFPRGQMVQFAQVSGGGNCVNYNVEENIMGQSNPEDGINMYLSSGLPTDPIQIIGNWIRGGGPSESGAGIQVGDGGGSNILVKDNILVNPGSCGISIATGNNISVKNNKVYAKYFSFNYRGITVRNLYSSTTTCYSDTVMNNQVNYTSGTNSCTYTTSYLNSGACGEVIGWSTNVFNTSLTESILPPVIIGRAALAASSSTSSSSTSTTTSGSTSTTTSGTTTSGSTTTTTGTGTTDTSGSTITSGSTSTTTSGTTTSGSTTTTTGTGTTDTSGSTTTSGSTSTTTSGTTTSGSTSTTTSGTTTSGSTTTTTGTGTTDTSGSTTTSGSTSTTTSGTTTSGSTTTTTSGTTTTTTTKPTGKKRRRVIEESVLSPASDSTSVEGENAISVSYLSGRTVVIMADKPETVTVMIYNLNGQKVIDKRLSESTTEISTDNLKKGVYVAKISDNGKLIETKKLIIGQN